MQGTFNITTDEDLQKALMLEKYIPESMTIPSRVYCSIPRSMYEEKIPTELGDGRKRFNSVYKDNTPHLEDDVYILLGENIINSNGSLSGGRDLQTGPVTKEELFAHVELFGVEHLHLDFPREVIPDDEI